LNPDEAVLIDRARRGEPAAFRKIVESFQGRIFRTVAGMTGDREEARDLTQEAFLKAFEALDAFKGGSSLHTWLYRIAVNLCIDQLRGRRKRPLLFDPGDTCAEEGQAHERVPDPGAEDPLENALRREKAAAIQGALERLSPDHRAIIILREVEGLSYEEIAAVLRIGLGTVMSRLHYARAHLKDALASYVREGEGGDEETIRVLQPVPKKA
jgi:RNA polymerase sigma-70 factor (ECF subfamily)